MVDFAELELRISSNEVGQADQRLDEFARSARTAEQAGERFNRKGRDMSRVAREANRDFGLLSRGIGAVGAALVTFAGARASLETLTSIEDGLVGIGKTAGLTKLQLEDLGDSYDRLGTRLSTPIAKLFEVGQVAGQLGVSDTRQILEFTETIAKLGDAAPVLQGNLEGAALELAKLNAVTGSSIDDTDRLASVIVRLGNEYETMEDKIIATASEAGKAGAAFGVSATQSVALATAFDRIGTDAELARSAVVRTFAEMEKAIGSGGPALQGFADITGASMEEFVEAFDRDPVEVLEAFIRGLDQLNQANVRTGPLLAELGLNSVRVVPTLQTLAASSEKLSEVIQLAGLEFKYGSALEDEFTASSDRLSAAFGRLANTGRTLVNDVLSEQTGISGGLRGLVETGTSALRILGGLDDASDRARQGAEGLADGIKLVSIALTALAATRVTENVIAMSTAALSGQRSFGLLAGGVGLAAASMGDLEDGLQTAAALAVAVNLLPLTQKASDAAREFLALRTATNAAYQIMDRGKGVVLGSAEAARQQALAAKSVAAAHVAETQAAIGKLEVDRNLVIVSASATAQGQLRAQQDLAAVVAVRARAIAEIQLLEAERARLIVSSDAFDVARATLVLDPTIAEARAGLAVATNNVTAAQARLNAVTAEANTASAARAAQDTQRLALEGQLTASKARLAAAEGTLSAASRAAAISTTVFSRAMVSVRGAVTGVTAAIAANPFGALLVGAALVLPFLDDIKEAFDETSEAAEKLKLSNEALQASIEGVTRARAAQRVAEAEGDSSGVVRTIQQQIQALEDLKTNIELLRERGAGVSIEQLISLGGPDDAQLQKDAEDLRDRVSEAVATAFEAGFFDSTTLQKIDGTITMQQRAIFKSIQDTTERLLAEGGSGFTGADFASVIDTTELERGRLELSRQADAIAKVVSSFANNAAPTEEDRARFQKAIEGFIDPAIIAVPVDEALELVRARIEEISKARQDLVDELEGDQARFGGEARTPQSTASTALDELQKELEFRRELAALSEDEAAIQQKLAEVRSIAAAAELSDEETESRVGLIRVILEQIDALETEREVRARLEADREDFRASFDQELDALRDEIDLIYLSAEARSVETQVRDRQREAALLGIDLTAREVEEYRSLLKTLAEVDRNRGSTAKVPRETSLESTTRQLEEEYQLLQVVGTERDKLQVLLESENELRRSGVELSDAEIVRRNEELDVVFALIDAVEELRAAKEAEDQIGSTNEALERDLELLQLSGAERASRIIQLRLEDQIGRQLTETERGRIDLLTEQIQLMGKFRTLGEDAGRSIGNALEQAIQKGGTFKEFLSGILQDLSSAAFQEFITAPLGNALGDFASRLAPSLGEGAEDVAGAAVLETSAAAAGLSLTTASTTAGATLTTAGATLGASIITAAAQAAALLSSASASSGIAGAASGVVGAVGPVGPVPSRLGNVFDSGARVTAYARGGIDRGVSAGLASGIVDNPTMVPQALIGEGSRAEGIFPLEKDGGKFAIMAMIDGRRTTLPVDRLADGNLGVRYDEQRRPGSLEKFARGGVFSPASVMPATATQPATRFAPASDGAAPGGGGTTSQTIVQQRRDSYQINVTTPNADSFRANQAQIMSNARRLGRLS